MKTYDKEADEVKVFSDFINTHIGIELQDKVEYRKNQCPACYLGRPGSKYLKKIVDLNRGKKIIKETGSLITSF